ncbi:MAG: ABC transporter ATP-binding protein [Acuticoccus sp.]
MSETALSVRDLTIAFKTRNGMLTAVHGVSFDVARGEVLGLVGESGSGKSVTGLAVMGLLDAAGRITAGSVRLLGQELTGLPERRLRKLRGRDISMIFQDPSTTLNPVLRVDTQMIEALKAHERLSQQAARERALAALKAVGIPSPAERLTAYPHQFSGGMRQRLAIAIALLHRPAVLIADEPTTALDVTIQAQVLSEVQKLAADQGTALVWISHDLSVVSGLADRVAVMYAGNIVETGSVGDILIDPAHPYTAGLIASVPSRNRRGVPLAQIRGAMPSLSAVPPGCAFHPRCDHATGLCATSKPAVLPFAGRTVRCHHPIAEAAARAAPAETLPA